jgi:amidase
MNPVFWSASKLVRALRSRKIGALELLDLYANRIERYDVEINAIPVLDLERARKRARGFDRKRKPDALLAGLPMTVKESFDVAGLPTTWGVLAYKDVPVATNAVAVERFLRAGGNVFGKSNVPVLLADWETNNPVYGKTVNPWDRSRTPGGSSGGAAAALAAGLTALEIGSDIGGSIRNPAHYCGVFGHKPTWGICSPIGQALSGVKQQADISVIGPLARSAEDLLLAFRIMAGPDDIDGAGWKLALPRPQRKTLRGWRVAVLKTHPTAEVDASVQASIDDLAHFLARRGAKVSDRALPDIDLDEAHRVFIQLLRGATSARQNDETVERLQALRSRLSPDDESYYARMVRGNTQLHKDWLIASNRRHHMRLAWAEFFRDWDVLLCPNAATAAFPHSMPGERWERMIDVNGKPQPATTQMWWAGISGMCYLPGTVAPIALSTTGLPIGVQIVGPQHGDLTTLRFAQLLEREYRGFVPAPDYGD